jgi:hypothetical protein
MPTECSRDLFGFAPVEGREVVAAFGGGAITSDAGALLLTTRPCCSWTRCKSDPCGAAQLLGAQTGEACDRALIRAGASTLTRTNHLRSI